MVIYLSAVGGQVEASTHVDDVPYYGHGTNAKDALARLIDNMAAHGAPLPLAGQSAPGTDAMEPIPDYGDHMTLDDFVESCEQGMFIDDDGSGCYATLTQMSRKDAAPSDIANGEIDRSFTHVVWFNK